MISTVILALLWLSMPNVLSSPTLSAQQARRNDVHFTFEKGLFVQESKASELRSPGQHPDFGAKPPWPEILKRITPGRKLLLLVRHGQATSNAVQAAVGDEFWEQDVASQCSWYNATSGETLDLFDPALTTTGRHQAESLRETLQHGSIHFKDLTGGKAFKVIVSPLRRTLETFQAALGPLAQASTVAVDEFCRERLGKNTCDARHPATQPDPTGSEHQCQDGDAPEGTSHGDGIEHGINCSATWALSDKFPGILFPVTGLSGELGLVSEHDSWWQSNKRESDEALNHRALVFLERIFAAVTEDVVFVVTHSGMIGAILAAMGREPYSATNAELVPALVITDPATQQPTT